MFDFLVSVGAMGAVIWFLRQFALRQYLPYQLVVPLVLLLSVIYSMDKVTQEQERAAKEQGLRGQQQARDARQEEYIRLLARALSVPWEEPGAIEPSPLPSVKAVELAQLIGPNDGPYAQALKATTERRYLDARSFFAQAETNGMDLRTLYIARADMEGYAGAYGQQIDWLKKILNLRPDEPEVLVKLGNALMAMGKFDEAQPHLERAARIWEARSDESAGALTQTNLACAYLQQGDPEKAKTANDAALETLEKKWGTDDPHTAIGLQNAAGIEDTLGHDREAEELLHRALRLQGESCPDGSRRAWTMNKLGRVYRKRGDSTRAENAFTESVALAEKCSVESGQLAEFLVDLASLHSDLGRHEEAEPRFDRALWLTAQSTGPERIRVLEQYRKFLLRTGRGDEASRVEGQLAMLRQNAPLRGDLFLSPPPPPAS